MKPFNFAIANLAALFTYAAYPIADLEFVARRHSLRGIRGNRSGEFLLAAALQL
jgi:hypothetical protein